MTRANGVRQTRSVSSAHSPERVFPVVVKRLSSVDPNRVAPAIARNAITPIMTAYSVIVAPLSSWSLVHSDAIMTNICTAFSHRSIRRVELGRPCDRRNLYLSYRLHSLVVRKWGDNGEGKVQRTPIVRDTAPTMKIRHQLRSALPFACTSRRRRRHVVVRSRRSPRFLRDGRAKLCARRR
jgi:hypothetical protein